MSEQRYITTIWKIMDELHGADQLESVLSGVLEILCDTLPCEDANIWMRNSQDHRVYIVSCKGSYDFTGYSMEENQEPIGKVITAGETLNMEDCRKNEIIVLDKDLTRIFGENSLLVPLKTPFGILGCIQFKNKAGGFDEEDIKLVGNCASLLALDIEDKGLSYNPNENKEPLVSVRNVIKEFPSGEEIRRILNDVDLDIYQGELLVVLGESGCGKSTLLNIIGGMDQMTSGQLLIEGKDFSHPTEQELTDYRRDYIGFIFQAYNLMPNLNALENIQFIAEVSKNPMDCAQALEMVGLGEKADRYPSAMSGGQQQRVCIARAICKSPKLILADEPTAALDFQTGQGVLKVIEKIVKENGTTVIMVTHNVEIAKMANRVIKLKNGRISSIRVNMHPLAADDLVW